MASGAASGQVRGKQEESRAAFFRGEFPDPSVLSKTVMPESINVYAGFATLEGSWISAGNRRDWSTNGGTE